MKRETLNPCFLILWASELYIALFLAYCKLFLKIKSSFSKLKLQKVIHLLYVSLLKILLKPNWLSEFRIFVKRNY
jgi:hypothetical protein